MTVHPLITSTQRAARPLSLICDVAFGVPSLTIPDGYWMSAGDEPEDGAGDRLLCTVQVNGIDFLFDARAVDGENEEEFDYLYLFVEPDGDFATMAIRGRDYVVSCTPHAVEG